jgi:hypothetical protein
MYFLFSLFILVFLSIFMGSSLSFTSVKTNQYATPNPDTKQNELIEEEPKSKPDTKPIVYIPKQSVPEQDTKQEHNPEPDINTVQQTPNTNPSEYIVKPKYFKVI